MSRFLCLYIPHFAAWAMARASPCASPCPLLVYAGGRVVAASSEALAAGVQVSWPLPRAQALLPHARTLPHHGPLVATAWDTIVQTLYGLTPNIETLRQGLALTQHINEDALAPWLQEWGAQAGIASDRTTAELAALTTEPGKVRKIPEGRSHVFLRCVPMSVLGEVGVSPQSLERLGWFGWHNVSPLQRLTKRQLTMQFPEAELLHRYAQADDVRPVATYRPPVVLTARYEFEEPAREPCEFEPVVSLLLETVHLQLEGRNTQSLTIIAETAAGHVKGQRLLREASVTLPALRLAARHALDTVTNTITDGRNAHEYNEPATVLELHSLEVQLGHLAQPVAVQGQLFGTARPVVQKAIQAVEARFPGALRRIVTVNPYAYLPEEGFRFEPAISPNSVSQDKSKSFPQKKPSQPKAPQQGRLQNRTSPLQKSRSHRPRTERLPGLLSEAGDL